MDALTWGSTQESIEWGIGKDLTDLGSKRKDKEKKMRVRALLQKQSS